MRYLTTLFLALPLLVACTEPTAPAPASPTATAADSPREFDDYQVYFAAFTTDQLSPEVARAYGITRSANRVMVNISVLRKQEDAPGKPVTATLSGTSVNLSEQLRTLSWREISEGDGAGIYYIAELGVSDRETITFDLQVLPEGETSPLPVRFTQQFFTR